MTPDCYALLTLFLNNEAIRFVVEYDCNDLPAAQDDEEYLSRSHPEIDFFRESEYDKFWRSKLGEYANWSIVSIEHVNGVLS